MARSGGAYAQNADAINTTTYTVRNLNEYQMYVFQVYGGDDQQGKSFDSSFAAILVQTLILRTRSFL